MLKKVVRGFRLSTGNAVTQGEMTAGGREDSPRGSSLSGEQGGAALALVATDWGVEGRSEQAWVGRKAVLRLYDSGIVCAFSRSEAVRAFA